MRRLIAALSLLSLANLVFAQGSSACPLASAAQHTATMPVGAEHAGHDMGAMAQHDMAQPLPDDSSSHPPACLTMGPCAVTLDVAAAVVASATIAHDGRMVARSEHLPPSAATAPEPPPPRA